MKLVLGLATLAASSSGKAMNKARAGVGKLCIDKTTNDAEGGGGSLGTPPVVKRRMALELWLATLALQLW